MAEPLATPERKEYLTFHQVVYTEDLGLSKDLLERSPRWSIITGYYAMYSLAKLYLGKEHNLKVSDEGEGSHVAVVRELHRVLTATYDERRAKEVIETLKKADAVFVDIQQPRHISGLLNAGREERRKAQYYTRSGSTGKLEREQAEEFQTKIVMVFVKLMGEMLNAS